MDNKQNENEKYITSEIGYRGQPIKQRVVNKKFSGVPTVSGEFRRHWTSDNVLVRAIRNYSGRISFSQNNGSNGWNRIDKNSPMSSEVREFVVSIEPEFFTT